MRQCQLIRSQHRPVLVQSPGILIIYGWPQPTPLRDAPVAVVTGGARGIGLATAGALLAGGYRVVIADRDDLDPDGAEESATIEVVESMKVDVADSASVDRMFAEVEARFGRVDALVNAAGTTAIRQRNPSRMLRGSAVRSSSRRHVSLLPRAFPRLRRNGGGIVNFSSIAARRGRPGRAPYSAAKAGIEAMTRTLAIEWAAHGVRVNAVVPGFIDTRLVRANLASGASRLDDLCKAIPLKRLGRSQEVATVVAFLLSPPRPT